MGIVGASGFIGGELVRQASEAGWEVVGYSRSERKPGDGVSEWREWGDEPCVCGLDVIVNLAGEGIDKRWTEERKKQFRESRVGVVETIVGALRRAERRPLVFLNGTAVGIYGDGGDEVIEEGAPVGDGYLAELCRDWEKAADPAADLDVRVLQWRTGVVLGEGDRHPAVPLVDHQHIGMADVLLGEPLAAGRPLDRSPPRCAVAS